MSRYPSRSLVSIVATGSDNQRRRFCLNMEVCLLAFPHAIPPSSPFYRQLYPILCLEYFPGPISALSRLVSPCLRPHVCASANYPSPFNTTSLSLSSSVLPRALAEFMLENHLLCPLSSSDLRPRDKAIKRTLRLTVALTMAIHGVVTGRRAWLSTVSILPLLRGCVSTKLNFESKGRGVSCMRNFITKSHNICKIFL